MTKPRTKAKALLAVPQSREQAVGALARIGTLRGAIAAAKARHDKVVRAAGEAYEREVAQPRAELAEAEAGLQAWCEANRAELTRGKGKTIELGTGRVSWRTRPPRVGLRHVEGVIEACRTLGLDRFLRTKVEVNREAMLAEPKVAQTVAGVSIGSEGEEFVIEPAGLDVGS